MKQISKNKRGVMGLDVAKAFVLGLLSLVIIGVTVMIVLSSLGNVAGTTNTFSGSVTNETGAWINSTGYTVTKASETGFGTFAVTAAYNYTDSTLISTGNYTAAASTGIITNATATNWANVSVSYTYQYTKPSGTALVIGNTSSGLTSFFSNVTTWLALLGVVILILIIAVVIVVVNRFGGAGASGGPSF